MWRNLDARLIARFIAVLAVALSNFGCVLTDKFQDRTLEYNYQAAYNKGSMLLSNVMRAAYALPLQFSELSTVTGQAAAQASVSSTLPFKLSAPTPPTLTGTATPGAGISGNSTFAVANLNTKEFYSGLQTPISKAQISFYLRTGFPADVLLPLVISTMEIERPNGVKVRMNNSAQSQATFRRFNSALAILIASGLTTEDIPSAEPLGPILSRNEAAHPLIQAQLVAAGEDAPRLQPDKNGFKLARSSKAAQFCFDPLIARGRHHYADGDVVSITKAAQRGKMKVPLIVEGGRDRVDATFIVYPEDFCGNKAPSPKDIVKLKITTRSLEGILTYLGEIVRTELGLAAEPVSLELTALDGSQYRLFHVEPHSGASNAIWTYHNGVAYSIKPDPTGVNASSRVFQLLTDLMALQSSSKNLPSPTVVSIVGQ